MHKGGIAPGLCSPIFKFQTPCKPSKLASSLQVYMAQSIQAGIQEFMQGDPRGSVPPFVAPVPIGPNAHYGACPGMVFCCPGVVPAPPPDPVGPMMWGIPAPAFGSPGHVCKAQMAPAPVPALPLLGACFSARGLTSPAFKCKECFKRISSQFYGPLEAPAY